VLPEGKMNSEGTAQERNAFSDRENRMSSTIAGRRSKQLLKRMSKAVPAAMGGRSSFFVARAEGAGLWSVDGRRFVDFAGGVGCLNVGHSHPRVVAAIKRQAARFTHTDFSVVPYEGYVALAERLIALAPGPGLNQVAFFNTGAEAVENAVKVARIATARGAIIAFEGAFHGRTYMALSLTSKIDPYKRGMGPFMPEVYRAPYPDPYRVADENPTDFVMRAMTQMFVTHVDPSQVAAIIVEPILGEGGFVVPPPDFLPALRRLCDAYGILLIVDEVQTGLGRTGKLWAVEHAGIEPDLMVVGKSLAAGLPLSAVVGRRELFDRVPAGAIGGTYPGNPVACAAALAVLDIFRDEHLVDRARWLGELIRRQFERFAKRYPLVGDVRGVGAMMAIELVRNRRSKEPAPRETGAVLEHALASGALFLRAGVHRNVIRVLAPLVIAEVDLKAGLKALDRALQAVNGQVIMKAGSI